MEDDFKEKGLPPQLLNLIPDEREWKVREAEDEGRSRNTSFDADEDKKLELKLGLPGVQEEESTAGPGEKKIQQQQRRDDSLGCFPKHSMLATGITATGAKRGFFATVGTKEEGHNPRPQDMELTLGGESMAGERKKGCCLPTLSHGSAVVHRCNSSNHHGRAAVPPVVGWPPVRSFRKNLTNVSSSKQSPERQNGQADDTVKQICQKRRLVKINMDGIPIGRKVDLAAHDSYQKLSSAIEELFRGFLEVGCSATQKDLSCIESGEDGAEEKIFSGLLDGTGEYTLVYEDNDGRKMLVGGIPWNIFFSTAKRLRVMTRSELPQDLIGAAPGRVADC